MIQNENYLEEIIIGDCAYYIDYDKNGEAFLKTYDEKYKMWMYLRFNNNDNNVEERMIKMLSDEFIQQTLQKT